MEEESCKTPLQMASDGQKKEDRNSLEKGCGLLLTINLMKTIALG